MRRAPVVLDPSRANELAPLLARFVRGDLDSVAITLPGAPVTKKNSPVLIGGRVPRMLPSAPYRAWLKGVMAYYGQRSELQPAFRAPAQIPWAGKRGSGPRLPVNAEAHIWLARDIGDFLGYADAIADCLQALGVVEDDRGIAHWDRSRVHAPVRTARLRIPVVAHSVVTFTRA